MKQLHRFIYTVSIRLFLFALLGVPFLYCGCMVNQQLILNDNGSGTYRAQGSALPFAGVVFDDLAVIGGYENAGDLYTTAVTQTANEFAIRPDIGDSHIEMSAPHEWSALIQFTDVESLLGGINGIPIAEINEENGTSTLNLIFDRERAAVLETIIPLLNDPALITFNPAMTQSYDEKSYISEVLSFTFGEENLPSVRAARVVMEIILPGPICSVEGGEQIDERRVRFETAFTRLIVPENPIQWRVSWKSLQ